MSIQFENKLRVPNVKTILTLAISFLLYANSCSSAEPVVATDARRVFKTVAPSVVLIKTYSSGHVPLKIGSGFFVAPGDALVTNAHVIAGAAEVEIVLSSGSVVPVTEVLALAADKDIAILSAQGPAIQLSERVPEVGQQIFVLGNPEGLSATFSNGIVSALRSQNGVPVIQITAPISPGSSGGPVVDESGQVLGVASFCFKEGQNLNFAVSSSVISPMLTSRKPMPLDLAGYKVDEAAKNNAVVYGQDRLVVVRATSKNGKLNIAIRNADTCAVHRVILRVLFYEDGRLPRLAEIRQEMSALHNSLAAYKRIAQYKQIITILDKDFRYWTTGEYSILREWSYVVTEYPSLIRDTPGHFLDRVNSAYERIATARRRAEQTLVDSRREASAISESDIEEKLAKLDTERKQLEEPTSSGDLLLIDYKDYTLDGVIAPGMTKSYEIQGKYPIAKPTIIDYYNATN